MPKHYAPIAGVNAEEFVGELPGGAIFHCQIYLAGTE